METQSATQFLVVVSKYIVLHWGEVPLFGGEGCSRKWDNHCTFPRLNAWLFTGICKLCGNDHLAAVGVENPGEDSFTVQCNVTSSKTMQFRRSSSMHSRARREICIILTQMMILFIGELDRSGRRFRPEKISEYENRANGRRWTDQSAFLRTCGTVYLWYMKIGLRLVGVDRNHWPASWTHVVMVDST